jgi:hypothetical protein
MDAPAIAQAKALDSKSSSPAKSVEAALPADKTVTAKVTQVTPDKTQANSHKVKLEINNTLLQISAKFTGKPPEPGSSVSITRSQSGQIQLSVNSDQVTPKPAQAQPSTTANTADNKAQNATRSLINNLSTPTPSTNISTSSQSVILKAPVIINASGESLAVIEKSLPKGQTLLARVIDQGVAGKQVTVSGQPSLNTSSAQSLIPASTLTTANPNQNLTQTKQPLSNSVISNNQTITGTGTLQARVNPATFSAATNSIANAPTANPNTTASPQSGQTISHALPPQAPTPQVTGLQPSSSTLSALTTTPAISNTAVTTTSNPTVTPVTQNNQAGQAIPASQRTAPTTPAATTPAAPIPKPVNSDTYSIRIVAPTAPQSPVQATPLTNTVANQTASPLTPQVAANVAGTSSPIPTTASQTPVPTALNSSLPANPTTTPTSTPTTPTTATNAPASPTGNPTSPIQSLTTKTTPSLVTQPLNTSTVNPQAPAQTTPAPTFSPPPSSTPQQASQPTIQAAVSLQVPSAQNPAPQNAQLSSLASPTATLKIAVAGQEVSLQAPANLPELKNVQITRVQGVQANIQWQQASSPVTQPIQTLSNLTPKQVTLVEQQLRQALPQQVPIAEGINQLVAQSAQLANTPGAVNTAVDKVALSIMQMFGVKPGANNSSDTIKRNVQQGGLFTEGKLLNQGAQQGDMKSFLSQLSKLADQLPAEQREMLQNTTDRMLARVTTNQLTHVQQQHVKADSSNERSFQIDIPVQNNEKLDNVEMEIKQRKHLNDEGDFVSIWSVKLHFDLEERGEVDAEVALNPTDNSISTTFLCTKLSTVQEIEQRMNGFRSQLNDHGFEVQTLHCTQGSQAANANNPISKRIIDIRT